MVKKLKKLLERANKIVVIDYYDNCPYQNQNGGSYCYVERLYKKNSQWEVYYGCSSDFSFCPIFGTFSSCSSCVDWDPQEGCKATPEVVLSPLTQEDLEDPLKEISIYAEDELLYYKPAEVICGKCYDRDSGEVSRCPYDYD